MPISVSGTTITFNDATTQSTAATGFPSGTVILFYQAAAPTGWTQVTTQNNKALRVVSGAGGVAGGTTGFSTVFANQTPTISGSLTGGTIGATTLSTSQMPSHAHFAAYIVAPGCGGTNGPVYQGAGVYAGGFNTDSQGGNGSHTHSLSGTITGLSSSAITLNVQYIDIILASKN